MALEQVPYTNFHDLNLDWVLKVAKEAQEKVDGEYADVTALIEQAESAATNAETQADLAASAALLADQHSQTAITAMTNAQAAQTGAETAYENTLDLYTDLTGTISGDVTAWLEDNITQETGYVLDDSLTVQGAAADAKAVGDAIGDVEALTGNNALAIQLLQIADGTLARNSAELFANNDPTYAYTVGDYCTWQNALYRCISDTTGGTFDSSAWESVSVGGDIKGLVEIASNTDFNIAMQNGYINANTGNVQNYAGGKYRRTTRIKAYEPGLLKITLTPKLDNTNIRVYYYNSDTGALASSFVGAEAAWAESVTITPDPDKPYMIVAVTDTRSSYTPMTAYNYSDLVEDVREYNLAAKMAAHDDKDRPIRVLGIGNSYLYYTFSYLAKILQEAGYTNVVLGMGYEGGATLAEQYANRASTSFYSNGFVTWPNNGLEMSAYVTTSTSTLAAFSLDQILAQFPWTHIIVQQQSDASGQYDSFVGTNFNINTMLSYVQSIAGSDVDISLFAPWTHAEDYAASEYASQAAQDAAIRATVPRVAAYMTRCDHVINELDAFVEARNNNYLGALGDEMTRDGNHPGYGVPMFLASFVVASTLFGVLPSDVAWWPTASDDANITDSSTAYLASLAKNIARKAAVTNL